MSQVAWVSRVAVSLLMGIHLSPTWAQSPVVDLILDLPQVDAAPVGAVEAVPLDIDAAVEAALEEADAIQARAESALSAAQPIAVPDAPDVPTQGRDTSTRIQVPTITAPSVTSPRISTPTVQSPSAAVAAPTNRENVLNPTGRDVLNPVGRDILNRTGADILNPGGENVLAPGAGPGGIDVLVRDLTRLGIEAAACRRLVAADPTAAALVPQTTTQATRVVPATVDGGTVERGFAPPPAVVFGITPDLAGAVNLPAGVDLTGSVGTVAIDVLTGGVTVNGQELSNAAVSALTRACLEGLEPE